MKKMLLSSTDSHLEIECVQAMLSISDCSSLESLSTFELALSPFWAAALKGPMTYAFTCGEISPSSSAYPRSPQPPGPYLSLKAHIPASRPKSQS